MLFLVWVKIIWDNWSRLSREAVISDSHLEYFDDYVLTQNRLCCWREMFWMLQLLPCLWSFILGISSYASSSLSTGSSLSTRALSSFGSSSYSSTGSSRKVPLFRASKDVLSQIVKTGLEIFDVSSSKELQDYLTYLTHEMGSEGTHYFILRKH